MAKDTIADLVKTGNSRKSRFRYAFVLVAILIAVISAFALLNITPPTVPTDNKIKTDTVEPDGVKILQVMLKRAGHFEGTPNGIFDKKTEESVRLFQQAEGLSVDGKPGGKTLSRLYQRSGGKTATEASVGQNPAEVGGKR